MGPETLIRLIGGEIGRTHRKAVAAVAEAIRQCHAESLSFHVEKFIRDPLLSLQLSHPLIIIIDGITEWTPHTHFIEQLAHLAPHTSLVRFIFLGRSQPIEERHSGISIRRYALPPVSVEDIAGYLNRRFSTIKWKDGGRPAPEDVLRLAALANGDFTRVEEVVSIIRDLPPVKYDDISKPIHNMARTIPFQALDDKFDHKILLNRVALALRPPGHPERDLSLNNLSASLDKHDKKSRSAGNLEECILLHREALALRPPGHRDRHYSCYNLANSLYNRFMKEGLVGDLEEAITLGKEALSLRPEGHEYRFITVYNQRLYLYDRFEINRKVEDLQEAITLAEEALLLCPEDDSDYRRLPGWISSYKADLAQTMASSERSRSSNTE
jgi:hypothetical protein